MRHIEITTIGAWAFFTCACEGLPALIDPVTSDTPSGVTVQTPTGPTDTDTGTSTDTSTTDDTGSQVEEPTVEAITDMPSCAEDTDCETGVCHHGSRHCVPPFSFEDGEGAFSVIGQDDLTTCLANQGKGPNPAGLYAPAAISGGQGRYAVADRGNNRVLLWDKVPGPGVEADEVLGQMSGYESMARTTLYNALEFP